jgi:hypothetical protein
MGCHASEEALERYSLGACSEAELAQIEEHLLICHNCQDRLAETDLLIRPLRAALAAEGSHLEGAASGLKPRKTSWFWPVPRKLVWVPALGVFILMLVGWRAYHLSTPMPQIVALAAFRGAESDVSAQAFANAPIELRLDVSSLRTSPQYRIEIVSATGTLERSGSIRGHPETTRFDAGRLAAGRYWVRLYDLEGTLLREYGLMVR